jgi:pyrimidine deaminase RibD-like protein
MTPTDFMKMAVALSANCRPEDAKRTPRLGVVIAQGEEVIAMAHRGTGKEGDDDHAELIAIQQMRDKGKLEGSTVYTTLEPCTHHSRRSTSEFCTALLIRERVGKVYVGVLDPNEQVCGRGVNLLQLAGIEVELFPDDLQKQIRNINGDFIRAQQAVSPKILSPIQGQDLTLQRDAGGGDAYLFVDVEFECENPPGENVRLIIQNVDEWWPQRYPISQVENSKTWKGTVRIGMDGQRTIHIVQSNALGKRMLDLYSIVIERNEERKRYLKDKLAAMNLDGEFWEKMPKDYHPIKSTSLPNGLDSLACVTVTVKQPEGCPPP